MPKPKFKTRTVRSLKEIQQAMQERERPHWKGFVRDVLVVLVAVSVFAFLVLMVYLFSLNVK